MSFSILLMIVLLLCDPSFAQICSVSCTQTAIVRNRPYEEAFEIIQNRDWEQQDDFRDDLEDLIIRHKRVKRTGYSEEHFEEDRAFEGEVSYKNLSNLSFALLPQNLNF